MTIDAIHVILILWIMHNKFVLAVKHPIIEVLPLHVCVIQGTMIPNNKNYNVRVPLLIFIVISYIFFIIFKLVCDYRCVTCDNETING